MEETNCCSERCCGDKEKTIMYIEVDFPSLLTLLLNLDEETDLSICKSIVSDILFKLSPDKFKEEIDKYFYSIGGTNDLIKDHPREYKQLCDLFGCIAMR